ncbi:MAG: toll/interleukin-1 receptor domain-containing protein [Sphingobacteriaceae bacterium]|nr:MAG: toll/interleukin-1 receptor domain-containing protein [Sphingobacteriaceae bacterium]
MQPVKTFLSYAHADESFKNELLEFLNPMEGAGEIELWHDREIIVGDEWSEEITKALDEADLILFLISPSFLASGFINKVEIIRAMDRHKAKKARLVPVVIRNCDLNSHVIPGETYRIKDFQGVPTDMKPVNSWPLRDDAWMNVVKGLRLVVNKIRNSKASFTS